MSEAELLRLRRSNASLRGHLGRLRREARAARAETCKASRQAGRAKHELRLLTEKVVELGLDREKLQAERVELEGLRASLEAEEDSRRSAIELMVQLEGRKESLEEEIEERVRERAKDAAELEGLRESLTKERKSLERSKKWVEEDRKRYHKSANKIREEVESGFEARVRIAAAREEARANARIAEAERRAKAAIDGAECTRINQLNVLSNRLASALSKVKPGASVLWDYLEQTNQISGYSGRKDCTDEDLDRIRAAHRASREKLLLGEVVS